MQIGRDRKAGMSAKVGALGGIDRALPLAEFRALHK